MKPAVGKPHPRITVVVPTYQHAAFIGACLDSILGQRCSHPYNILIGEDGSTDGTREICLAYQQRHPDRIEVLLNDRKNVIHVQGSPTGRWNVLNLYRRATGELVALCEGDDRWCDPEKLQRQADLLLGDKSIAGCFHDTAVINGNGDRTGNLFRDGTPDRLRLADLLRTRSLIHPSAFMFRNYRQFDRHPSWFSTVGSFDMVLFATVADRGDLLKVPGVLSEYRKHAGGITDKAHNIGVRVHFHRMAMWLHLATDLRNIPEHDLRVLLERHMRDLGVEHGRAKAIAVWWELVRAAFIPMVQRPISALRLLRVARRTPPRPKAH
ncbi:MAG: glycosyltransferase [Flavobacteriales bacterium]|nr:glycosyltransferase [Flavobacteriales bacterium]